MIVAEPYTWRTILGLVLEEMPRWSRAVRWNWPRPTAPLEYRMRACKLRAPNGRTKCCQRTPHHKLFFGSICYLGMIFSCRVRLSESERAVLAVSLSEYPPHAQQHAQAVKHIAWPLSSPGTARLAVLRLDLDVLAPTYRCSFHFNLPTTSQSVPRAYSFRRWTADDTTQHSRCSHLLARSPSARMTQATRVWLLVDSFIYRPTVALRRGWAVETHDNETLEQRVITQKCVT